jgi:hypothetical protein
MNMLKTLFALVLLACVAGTAHAQTSCTVTSQPGQLSLLADGQPAGSITPGALRNTLCGQVTSVTNVTATSYTSVITDQTICVSPTAATTVTLAPSPVTGMIQTVMDCGFVAANDNIMVQPASGTFAGGFTSVIMNQNGEALIFQFNGTNWSLR